MRITKNRQKSTKVEWKESRDGNSGVSESPATHGLCLSINYKKKMKPHNGLS
ncbi:MAG TPA: hypothetical protein PLO32_00720 [Chitinophagales bacterium]|nr:hypothetical protein [Chitinophagales bacterium]